jgi:hypothetical protein
MRRWGALATAAVLLAGCGGVSFRKPASDDELRLKREVQAFYADLQRAFVAGNAQAVSLLFDASAKPLTRADVSAWAEKYFAANPRAWLRVAAFELDEVGYGRAVTTVELKLGPPDPEGRFGGRQTHVLVKRGGRWYIAETENAPGDAEKR